MSIVSHVFNDIWGYIEYFQQQGVYVRQIQYKTTLPMFLLVQFCGSVFWQKWSSVGDGI